MRLASHLEAYVDVQGRNIIYTTSGVDNDQRAYAINKNILFFNPKAGVTYTSGQHKAYLSAAHAGHEPNRNDFTDAADASTIKPEYMTDIEAGYQYRNTWLYAGINGFHMQYKDQLVLTGALNDVGAPLRLNIPNSFRRGIEVELAVQSQHGLYLQANATWSENKIEQFTETIYDYTDGGFAVVNNAYMNTDIAYSPRISGSAQAGFKHTLKKNNYSHTFDIAWITKAVGKQYLDNTQNENKVIDAYMVHDLRLGYTFSVAGRFELGINGWIQNMLDNYYETNGYTYSYISGSTVTEKFFYPQATRNYLVGVTLSY
jgi:iron complex outermembrane receptor protein